MMRMNLQCTPTLWVPFFSLLCMFSSQLIPLLCSQRLPQHSMSCSIQSSWQHALAVQESAGLWSASEHQQALPWSQTLWLSQDTHPAIRDDISVQPGLRSEQASPRSQRWLRDCCKGTEKRAAFEQSQQRGAALTHSLSPRALQGFDSAISFRFCMSFPSFPSIPENFGSIFPRFLLLKKTSNPTRLLDRAWQNFEDLLKTGDNEQKQEEWLWR